MIARRKDRLKVEVRKNQLLAFAGLGEEVAVRVEHPAAAPEADAVLLAGEVGHRQRHAVDHGIEIERALPAHRIGELAADHPRSEEHTSELQSLMRTSYAVFCLKKK